MIEIKEINEEFINLLKEDYKKIKEKNIEMNYFHDEINDKLKLINSNLKDIIDRDDINLLKKKRRNMQFQNESLISNWVDIEEKIYDEEEFVYLEDNKNENFNNQKIDEKDNKENILDEKYQKNNKSDCKNKKFCLYCDIFKAFEI